MKKIKVWWDTDFVGSDGFDEIEVEDNATDDEIEEIAKDVAFNHFSWGWEVVPNAK